MDQLIIQVLQGTASASERERLRSWRESSPANEQWYQEVSATWNATASHPEHAETNRPLAHDIVSAAETGRTRRHQGNRTRPFRQAAAVAAALILGLFIGESRPAAPIGASALEAAEFVTGTAELATARLSDGTVVRLAPSTRLRVGGGDGQREVWLDGKAYFAVARDDSAPFTVRTRAGDALVLGTRFEVDVTSDDLRVLVVEGSVEVGSEVHRVKVEAGSRSRTVRGLSPEVSQAEDVLKHLDWMGQFMAFENTPLRQVAREIQDRYGIRVEIPDSALARRTVTAWFGDDEPEAILKVICRIANAHCSIRDHVASIEP